MRTPSPPRQELLSEMKPSSSYLLLKFVYLAAYWSVTSFLRGAPLLRKILDPPLQRDKVVDLFRSQSTDRNSPSHFSQTVSLPQLGNLERELKISFHFPRVFILIFDRSVWHNEKHPQLRSKAETMANLSYYNLTRALFLKICKL